jgi:hypothetical protein
VRHHLHADFHVTYVLRQPQECDFQFDHAGCKNPQHPLAANAAKVNYRSFPFRAASLAALLFGAA